MTTAVFTIASLLIASVAAAAVLYQAWLLRFSIKVQSLLALDQKFSETYKGTRHLAASELINNKPGTNLDDVLDFLDTIGLLVRRGALDEEMVWHTFFYWIFGYWHAAKAHIEREREKNPLVWNYLPDLYNRVLAFEKKKGKGRLADSGLVPTEDDVKEFLQDESGHEPITFAKISPPR